MNINDIHFVLPSTFTHSTVDNVDVFCAKTYLYGFSFSVSIHSGSDVLMAIVPTRNGEQADDLVLTQTGDGEYTITDNNVVRRGNYAYGVKVRTAKNRVYDKFFHLKILSAYSRERLGFTSLSTYGLHENLSKLRVVAHVDAVDHVDSVKLSRRSGVSVEVYLGEMTLNNGVYEFEDLLFDVVDHEFAVTYTATVITSTDASWCRSLTVPIKRSSMSPNVVSAVVNDDVHRVYGGVTCRVANNLSVFNDEIVTTKVYVDADSSTLKLALADGRWSAYAENFVTTWPAVFNKNVTNANPNVFTFAGNCVVTDGQRSTTGVFTCTLTVGDDLYLKFSVRADEDELSLRSDLTANNVVLYGVDDLNVLDEVHNDIYVSTNVVRGFLTENIQRQLGFIDVDQQFKATAVHTSTAGNFVNSADVLAATDAHVYALNFSRTGVDVSKFDGINFDNYHVSVNLNDSTVAILATGASLTFDKSNNILLNFYDGDGLRSLKRVAVVNDACSSVQLDKRLVAVYGAVERATLAYTSALTNFTYDGITYSTSFNSTYSIVSEGYLTLNVDNFVQKFTTIAVTRVLRFTTTLRTVNPATGAPVNIAAQADVTSTATARVFDVTQVVDVVNHSTRFKFGDVEFSTAAQHLDNQNPANVMEFLNDQYYVKFERANHSTSTNDYGYFRSCSLYSKTIKLCSIPLEAYYGSGCTEKLYRYADFVKLRVIAVNDQRLILAKYTGSQALLTLINVPEDKSISTTSIDSSLITTQLMHVGDKCLGELEHMLTGASQYASTPRTMYVFTVSDDRRQPTVVGLAQNLSMVNVDNLVTESNDTATSWVTSVTVDWPLNVKNRNSMLSTIDVKVLGDKS